LILSAPSLAPAWPLTDQKTDLFLWMRSAVIGFTKVGVLDPWATVLVNNLLKGGVAWADAEKAKIADLNWRIVAVKPMH
jgi:sterol 24-C-methyltransferase